jgi:germination protein M
MGKPRTPHKPSLGVLFWIAAILLVSIVLMFSLPSIRSVLESTGFVDVVFEGAPPAASPPAEAPVPPDTREMDEQPPAQIVPDSVPDPIPDPAAESEEIELSQPPRQDPEQPEQERTMRTTLYLIRVTDDGRIIAEAVTRTIRFTRSPLTQTLETLIAGPDADDLNRGLLSLIPAGSRILGARIENGVAHLSFNEAFRFNDLGLEGHLAQLQQIVLTATNFPSVDAVQILIEGQRVDYLGGDGVFVGRPLTAADFRN